MIFLGFLRTEATGLPELSDVMSLIGKSVTVALEGIVRREAEMMYIVLGMCDVP